MKYIRTLLLILSVSTLFAVAQPASAANKTNLNRREIKQMPITQRPSRPGHFYGNTVRRAHERRSG